MTIFAIWIKKQGLLRNERGVFATSDRAVADSAASFFGNRARVLAIDESFKDFEPLFLAEEKRGNLWATLTS